MQTLHSEPCIDNPTCELRIGPSSWDPNEMAMKFTWFTSNGSAARGGEFPLKALLQMVTMAIKHGYLKLIV